MTLLASPIEMGVPRFTMDGLLPGFLGHPAERNTMSPYKVTTPELVAAFAFSVERVEILRGLLELRRRLHRLGFVEGIQWIDGSFVEKNDAVKPPRDVDIVTFFFRPPSLSAPAELTAVLDAHPEVFSHEHVKRELHCDLYWVDLSVPRPLYHVDQARYWFGLFSHRRITNQRKGLLQLELGSITDDQEAANILRLQDDSQD